MGNTQPITHQALLAHGWKVQPELQYPQHSLSSLNHPSKMLWVSFGPGETLRRVIFGNGIGDAKIAFCALTMQDIFDLERIFDLDRIAQEEAAYEIKWQERVATMARGGRKTTGRIV